MTGTTPTQTRPRWFLLLSAVLFLAWLGWLLYLVLTTTRPIVLSRPQFLVSSHDLIVLIADADGKPAIEVIVLEVHWPKDSQHLEGKKLLIPNLSDAEGYVAPGTYIVPLAGNPKGDFRVVPLPPSPGFDRQRRPRIYLFTPQTRMQLEQIEKPTG